MHRLKKVFSAILCILVLFTCLTTPVYAEEDETKNYKIDSYVTQESIEDDTYFEEDNTLKWVNNLFRKMQFKKNAFESLTEVEDYLKENFETVNPYVVNADVVLTKTIKKPHYNYLQDELVEEYGKEFDLEDDSRYILRNVEIPSIELDLTEVNNKLADDQLVMLVLHRNNDVEVYILHANTDENNDDVLLISSVGVFNLYKTKVHLNSLLSSCESFAFYSAEFPTYKVHPLPNWSSRYYSSPFGMRIHPITGEYTMHSGVDIPASMGTDVYAVQDGVVTVADAVDDSSAGCWVEIKHEDGYTTRYLHASRIYVVVGQHVKAGETIMAVGSTGASTGPHLHFCYVLNGECLDPEPYLASIIE